MEHVEQNLLKEGERIDDLQVKGLRIIQNPSGFCFGMDAVLVSNFARVKKGAKVVDLGTGTGIIPILVAGKSDAHSITGIEIQESVVNMAQRSVKLNGLEERIHIIHDTLCNVENHVKVNTVDVVISNPPYFAKGGAIVNPGSSKAVSRHEIHCTLEDVIQSSARLLKPGGVMYMVHRPHRLVDIMCTCRKFKLEPKLIQFVHPYSDAKPNMLLIKCVKGSGSELKYLQPLFVYHKDGSYTKELLAMYENQSIDPIEKGRE